MNTGLLTDLLEQEWAKDSGFFGKLRVGIFDHDGLERLQRLLEKLSVEKQERFDKRLVSLIWYIPLFMTWQIERVEENGGDTQPLEKGINKIQTLLEEILGVP